MTSVARADGRALNELRPITITRGWSNQAEGSALVEFGDTRVLCTASFTEGVPRWLKSEEKGWITAEYAMLPRATGTRSSRESVKGKRGTREALHHRSVRRSAIPRLGNRAGPDNRRDAHLPESGRCSAVPAGGGRDLGCGFRT